MLFVRCSMFHSRWSGVQWDECRWYEWLSKNLSPLNVVEAMVRCNRVKLFSFAHNGNWKENRFAINNKLLENYNLTKLFSRINFHFLFLLTLLTSSIFFSSFEFFVELLLLGFNFQVFGIINIPLKLVRIVSLYRFMYMSSFRR